MSRQKNRRADKRKSPANKTGQLWLMVLVAIGAITILFVPPETFKSKTASRGAAEPADVGRAGVGSFAR
jgi:hypothetical protein